MLWTKSISWKIYHSQNFPNAWRCRWLITLWQSFLCNRMALTRVGTILGSIVRRPYILPGTGQPTTGQNQQPPMLLTARLQSHKIWNENKNCFIHDGAHTRHLSLARNNFEDINCIGTPQISPFWRESQLITQRRLLTHLFFPCVLESSNATSFYRDFSLLFFRYLS